MEGLGTSPTSTVGTGKAKLCALDDVKFDTYKEISIPATSVGTPTSSVVPLTDVPSSEASYGCPFGPKEAPDLFVAWDNQARPPATTAAFIAKAGEYLTGATNAELRTELAACVTEALKPDSGEMADREFRGVKIECQAFTRDGGGGSGRARAARLV